MPTCTGTRTDCRCPSCSEILQTIAAMAAHALENRTRWTHTIAHDYRHGLRTESVTPHAGLTPDEAIASRIQRLRWISPEGGWSRDGMTLHIPHVYHEEWITYLPPDAHTEPSQAMTLLDDAEGAEEAPAFVDVPLPGMHDLTA